MLFTRHGLQVAVYQTDILQTGWLLASRSLQLQGAFSFKEPSATRSLQLQGAFSFKEPSATRSLQLQGAF
ncbi:MAG: hypothetical protein CMQ11_17970, partial [Gammaproteobacteria bacterium]|nr:hypothetical protein [Gammaproteobacteria bacterium]